jgi:excisionase family DNA binding protein
MFGQNDHDLLTVSEVAQQLRVDDTTVRRWIKNGVLEAVTLPHVGDRQSYRVRRQTMNHLLNGAQESAAR